MNSFGRLKNIDDSKAWIGIYLEEQKTCIGRVQNAYEVYSKLVHIINV